MDLQETYDELDNIVKTLDNNKQRLYTTVRRNKVSSTRRVGQSKWRIRKATRRKWKTRHLWVSKERDSLMNLAELDMDTLFRQYGFCLKNLELAHKQKKDFEEEIKRRFDERKSD